MSQAAPSSPEGPSSIREEHIPVRRTARYALLGEAGSDTREVWFVCHGYRQLARRFLRRFLPIAAPERLLVAPEGLSRFYLDDGEGPHGPDSRVGATWMTREDRLSEITDYVAALDTLYDHVLVGLDRGGVRIRVLGFSQGAHTASRWLALGRAEADELVLWAEVLPRDFPWEEGLERLRRLRLTLITGSADPWLTPDRLESEAASLRERGVSCRTLIHPEGHVLQEGALRALAADPPP